MCSNSFEQMQVNETDLYAIALSPFLKSGTTLASTDSLHCCIDAWNVKVNDGAISTQ